MKKNNLLVAGVLFGFLGGLVTVSAAGPASINFGSAGTFTVLAKSGISTTGATSITGNIGVSPAAATFITGFGLIASSDATFSTTPIVVGNVYAASYTSPTPITLTTAVSDMETAYTDGAGRSNPTATELGAGNIGGLTITPGLYKWGTGVVVPSNVTLSGGANDVWIFQVAGTLTVSSGVQVILSGGAQASNVYWIVAGQTTIGTTANFNGNVLDKTAIVLNTGARLQGKALAQTAVTLDASIVTNPTGSSATVTTPAITPAAASPSSVSPTVSNSGTYSNTGVSPSVTTVTPPSVSGSNTMSANTSTSVTTNTAVSMSSQIKSIILNLIRGSKGNEVAVLQNFLISQNKGQASQALMRVGATGYFGSLTRSALAEFQLSVGISPASGNFGPITRAYISSH
jgi:hypothetical protein